MIARTEEFIMRGPIRIAEYKPHRIKDSKLIIQEEHRRNCKNGIHQYYVKNIVKGDPFLLVTVKFKCLFCDNTVTKLVSPYD